MKKIILFIILIFIFSCNTMQTPIVIEPAPILSFDATDDEYTKEAKKLNWANEIKKYIEDLITQITNKVNYIDLREKNKKNKETK